MERISRRAALRSITALAATLVLSDLSITNIEAKQQGATIADLLPPQDTIKKVEENQAGRPLDINQGKELLILIGELVGRRNDGVLNNPQQLIKNTFLLTNGTGIYMPPSVDIYDNPYLNPIVINFYQNYPEYEYSETNAKTIIRRYYRALGQVPPDREEAFINIDATNNVQNFTQNKFPNSYFQYYGKDPHPQKVTITPVTAFRMISKHEWFHLDGWGEISLLDRDIAYYLQRMYQGKDPNISFSGYHDHFGVYLTTQSSNGTIAALGSKFNEFATDHCAIRFSQDYGLPFITGYMQRPIDHYNFRGVLDQSQIDFAEFYRLYRNRLLKNFYQKIALGARINESPETKLFDPEKSTTQDQLDFSIPLFPWWKLPDWNHSMMQELNNHYTNVLNS